ncbi:MAG: 50S ribosomal protein L2 [Candidatus Moranbacteria bacterium]|nr:50S ribosomal protein L2 [Candidatus Moranbacteria bacterium]
MSVKVYRKNNAGRRGMSVVKPENLTDSKPEKGLSSNLKRNVGRSNGKISIRHRGGGSKRRYRQVDFKMNKFDIPGRVESIEKDPNRSALIALVVYKDGEKRYVLATKGLKKGKEIITREDASVEEGNRLKLKNIPVGTFVSNVEMKPSKGGQLARSAGTAVVVQAVEGKMAHLKMSSGEVRMVPKEGYATVGQVSNFEHGSYRIGKAGRKRHMARRPKVRGSAMNPCDHPHGGGEGRQPIGLKYPKSPWGKQSLGKKTRKSNKHSSKYIIKGRGKKKRK